MGLGFSELMIVLVIVLILFGAGKLPKVMQEMGRGVKGFKDGMKEGEQPDTKDVVADNDKTADETSSDTSDDVVK